MNVADQVRLQHIYLSILAIETYLQDVSEEDFCQNSLLHSATVRQIIVIGEAIRNLSRQFRRETRELGWHQWSAYKEELVLEYFHIDYAALYQKTKKELFTFKHKVGAIIEKAT